MSYNDCIFYIRDNQKKLFSFDCDELFWDLPAKERCLSLADVEHALCEFHKYTRSEIYGGAKPKSYYKYQ